MKNFIDALKNFDCQLHEHYPMNKYVTLKVGGNANLVVYPSNYDNLIEILNCARSFGISPIPLGAGSNTIITDGGIKEIVLSTKKLRNFSINGNEILAECGTMLSTIMNNSIKKGLTGFEFAAGIPGTVGGGIFMNAGANGGEIKDVTKTVWIWHEGKEKEIDRKNIVFDYRKTNLPKDCVITKALFKLKNGNEYQSTKNVKDYLEHRNKTQPVSKANTGSIFKNPNNITAGKLLEELGLKGFTKGGAMFSDLHANFIINCGNAKAIDVIELIHFAKQKAIKERGIELETEVKIFGKN